MNENIIVNEKSNCLELKGLEDCSLEALKKVISKYNIDDIVLNYFKDDKFLLNQSIKIFKNEKSTFCYAISYQSKLISKIEKVGDTYIKIELRLKFKVWIMIVLLNYSMSLFANDSLHSSTGVLVNQDSTMISYDDLRIVNSKLIELDYEKEINSNLCAVVHNDSIVISDYIEVNKRINKDCDKLRRERNISFIVAIVGIITSIALIIK